MTQFLFKANQRWILVDCRISRRMAPEIGIKNIFIKTIKNLFENHKKQSKIDDSGKGDELFAKFMIVCILWHYLHAEFDGVCVCVISVARRNDCRR